MAVRYTRGMIKKFLFFFAAASETGKAIYKKRCFYPLQRQGNAKADPGIFIYLFALPLVYAGFRLPAIVSGFCASWYIVSVSFPGILIGFFFFRFSFPFLFCFLLQSFSFSLPLPVFMFRIFIFLYICIGLLDMIISFSIHISFFMDGCIHISFFFNRYI